MLCVPLKPLSHLLFLSGNQSDDAGTGDSQNSDPDEDVVLVTGGRSIVGCHDAESSGLAAAVGGVKSHGVVTVSELVEEVGVKGQLLAGGIQRVVGRIDPGVGDIDVADRIAGIEVEVVAAALDVYAVTIVAGRAVDIDVGVDKAVGLTGGIGVAGGVDLQGVGAGGQGAQVGRLESQNAVVVGGVAGAKVVEQGVIQISPVHTGVDIEGQVAVAAGPGCGGGVNGGIAVGCGGVDIDHDLGGTVGVGLGGGGQGDVAIHAASLNSDVLTVIVLLNNCNVGAAELVLPVEALTAQRIGGGDGRGVAGGDVLRIGLQSENIGIVDGDVADSLNIGAAVGSGLSNELDGAKVGGAQSGKISDQILGIGESGVRAILLDKPTGKAGVGDIGGEALGLALSHGNSIALSNRDGCLSIVIDSDVELAGDGAGGNVNGGVTGSNRCDVGRQAVRGGSHVDDAAGIDSPADAADNSSGGADICIDGDSCIGHVHGERSGAEGNVGNRNVNIDGELRSEVVVSLAGGSDNSLAGCDGSNGNSIGNGGVSGEAHAAAGDDGPFNALSCILTGKDGGFNAAAGVQTAQAKIVSAEADGGSDVRRHLDVNGVGVFRSAVCIADYGINLSGTVGVAAEKA